MKHCLVPPLLAAMATACAGSVNAAEPLPAKEMGSVQITSPTLPPCPSSTKKEGTDCTDTERLNELTNQSIKESLAPDPASQEPPRPVPQLPQPPDETPQQQQILNDFIHLPWGR